MIDDSLNHFLNLWDKAVEKGVFGETPKGPVTTPQTANTSFFGPVDSKPSNTARESDVQYWNDVYGRVSGGDVQVFNEAKKAKGAEKEEKPEFKQDKAAKEEKEVKNTIKSEPKEDDEKTLKKSAKSMARAANPVSAASVGKDQEMSAGSLGSTFGEEDLEELAELKKKLHDLTSKYASFVGDEKGDKKLQTKIDALKLQIDELSDQMCQSLGDKKTVKGKEVSPQAY